MCEPLQARPGARECVRCCYYCGCHCRHCDFLAMSVGRRCTGSARPRRSRASGQRDPAARWPCVSLPPEPLGQGSRSPG